MEKWEYLSELFVSHQPITKYYSAEYERDQVEDDLMQRLNELGQEGWEVIEIAAPERRIGIDSSESIDPIEHRIMWRLRFKRRIP